MKKSILLFASIFLLVGICELSAQVQLGQIIFGTADLDRTGSAVALSENGNRFAVGSSAFGGNFRGRVQVFDWNAGNMMWEQVGADLDNTGTNVFSFGEALSMSADGNRIAVGADGSSIFSETRGLVRVFEWDAMDEDWIQIGGDLLGDFLDQIGYSISLSADGKRLVVGFDANNMGPGSYPGSLPGEVRVYEYNDNNDSWDQLGDPIPGLEAFDFFGGSVDISANGSRIVASSSNYQMGRGFVQVYDWNSNTQTWDIVGSTNIATDLVEGSVVGWEVAINSDGNRIALSRDIELLPNLGRVQVFEWSNNSWTQVGADITGPPSTGVSTYGYTISLSASGNRISMSGASQPEFDFGSVLTYEWNATTEAWDQLGDEIGPPMVPQGESVYDYGSGSIDLSPDGNRLAIGASYDTDMESEVGLAQAFALSMVSSTHSATLEGLDIYPNPTTGEIYISGLLPEQVIITDQTGRVIKYWENGEARIDISNMPAGIYFLKIIADKKWAIEKMVKQ